MKERVEKVPFLFRINKDLLGLVDESAIAFDLSRNQLLNLIVYCFYHPDGLVIKSKSPLRAKSELASEDYQEEHGEHLEEVYVNPYPPGKVPVEKMDGNQAEETRVPEAERAEVTSQI
jgi:hypothetical protein